MARLPSRGKPFFLHLDKLTSKQKGLALPTKADIKTELGEGGHGTARDLANVFAGVGPQDGTGTFYNPPRSVVSNRPGDFAAAAANILQTLPKGERLTADFRTVVPQDWARVSGMSGKIVRETIGPDTRPPPRPRQRQVRSALQRTVEELPDLDETATCCRCNSKTHKLSHCLLPGPAGAMSGCPVCNIFDHSLATCARYKKLDDSQDGMGRREARKHASHNDQSNVVCVLPSVSETDPRCSPWWHFSVDEGVYEEFLQAQACGDPRGL